MEGRLFRSAGPSVGESRGRGDSSSARVGADIDRDIDRLDGHAPTLPVLAPVDEGQAREWAPAPPGDRLVVVDALRGVALFGILAVNIQFFASPYAGTGLPDPVSDGGLDEAARWLVAVGFETKFYLLFSFLFGYGLTIQMERAAARGARFAPRFARRLLGLAVLGALHAVFLFAGDILVTYAVLGVPLLLLRDIAPGRAVRVAATLVGALAAAYASLAVGASLAGGEAFDLGIAPEEIRRALDAYRGDPAAVIGQRLQELPAAAALELLFQAPNAFAMFLVGLAAGKWRLLQDPGHHAPRSRRLRGVGLGIGIPGAVAYAAAGLLAPPPGEVRLLAGLAVDAVTAPALAGAFLAGVLLLAQRPLGARVLRWFVPAGRLSLTNYLLQSAVCAFLFTGYGLGLMGRLGPAAVFALAGAIFALQLLLSAWWGRRFVIGPAEWLLRWVTYLQRPALRRSTG